MEVALKDQRIDKDTNEKFEPFIPPEVLVTSIVPFERKILDHITCGGSFIIIKNFDKQY